MKKVFCSECKHYRPSYVKIGDEGECDAPQNLKIVKLSDSWLQEGGEIIRHKNSPPFLNANNNCNWFAF